jgi:hypothetical protein
MLVELVLFYEVASFEERQQRSIYDDDGAKDLHLYQMQPQVHRPIWCVIRLSIMGV